MEDGLLLIRVIDHGAGIPQAFKSEMFKLFSQADASDTRQRGGTDLGLAISKRLVELHDGTIEFESEAGQGTDFNIRLPLH